jgi:chemotaxis methyl-accepting protein methylase/signal transduction histidine kinase
MPQESGDSVQQGSVVVEASFPVVGVAASAGGLEAFTQLLSHLPTDTGMAFVLIQHLSPDHESLLTEILARATPLPVREVRNGMTVEPNQVYVIPPNTKMILFEGRLQLSPREKVFGKYMPGDAFFASLAADRGHKAIAVVLSGSDGDGSLGLKAIKAAGGVTFAQCEDTAKFDSMPNTAVATGNVDFVLPPEKIAEELVNLSRNPMLACPLPVILTEELPQSGDALIKIFTLLRSSTGVDFSRYKSNTLDRRIRRRMLLYKIDQLAEYAAYLQSHPAEVKALYEEILIHVTSFFRDPEAFDLLKTRVFPTMMQNKSAEVPIRIWVAGCSTGEEVYSIAICLLEFLADHATQPPIQIFATDISELAIDKARAGIYAENQMMEVSAERRRRFFYPTEGDRYQITKAVRELCVFARQDLGSDPPFSNLDLISCRNVMIYLGDSLQQRIMPIFHYSLNPTGFLLLGTSESTGQYSDLFTLVEKKYRIYAKQATTTRPIFSFTPSSYPIMKASDRRSLQAPTEEFDFQKKVDQLIVHHYDPVGVVINDQMQVLQLRGDIDRYLKLVSGTANFNIFNLVRSGLLVELRAAIYQAQRQETTIAKNGLQIQEGEQTRSVNLQVIPFKVPIAEEFRFLVLFEEAPLTREPTDSEHPEGDLEQENTRLKQELASAIRERAATQEYLQAVIQEQEYSNQDFKVANEEILSSNEELQSTNEELETAKEEIQATNEELNTTNEELRSRNAELNLLNNDLTNLLASINIPILMLTQDLRIRRFTPMAQRLFNFIPADTGRPFSDIRASINLPSLEILILEVLETLSVKELDVQVQDGHWYTLRIRPYRTTDNQIDGVVLVMLDIDVPKRSAAKVEAARDQAETANLVKDEFLSNLSHELRNPLNTMLGWTQLLRTRKLSETAIARALETIERSARAQSKLIEDMLDIARITSGKMRLHRRRLDLVAVVGSAIEAVQISADAKLIQIVSSQLTSTIIIGDSDRLQQVLWNLLSNAVKFTPIGGRVEVRLEPLGTNAEIRVSDTGQGIRAELLPHIFDRFRQGDSSTSKASQGLGLGLSIVRHIVELHGGTVQAESLGEGQGTTIIVQLPLQSMPLEDALSIESATESAKALIQGKISLVGLQILVVDDDDNILELMQYLLEDLGAEVALVSSAKEAIAALVASPGKYHVLLADIGMPDENGFDLIRQVRLLSVEEGGQIPAAAITAYVSDRDRQMAIAAGFQMHIAKPVELEQLVAAIVSLTR